MMSGMYAAISGLQAHQTMLDITGNNLANVDTVAYKAQRTTFVDELSQLQRPATAGTALIGGSNPVQIGLGVQVGSIDNLMTQGSLQTTGNATDIAIQGDGFLTVQAGGPTDGQPAQFTPAAGVAPQFTRAGNLAMTPYTDNSVTPPTTNSYLTTQSGQYVMGTSAPIPAATTTAPTWIPIEIPSGATNVAIANNGQVTYTDNTGAQQTAGYIALATMTNEPGMQRDGNSLWSLSVNNGPPATAVTYGQPNTGAFGQTLSGQLEMSNVDMATEFTNMIQAQRGYQANAQTITTADQMMQTVVQMKQG